MNVNTTVAGLRDSIIEMVGIKAGLAISSGDFVNLLEQELANSDSSEWWYSPEEWLHSPASQWVRIRPENIESLVVRIMHAIGALPNPHTYRELLFLFAQENRSFIDQLEPDDEEDESPFPVTPYVRFNWRMAEWEQNPSTAPAEVRELLHEAERRSIERIFFDRSTSKWDGIVSLSELFEISHLGGEVRADVTSDPFIDQRFINYIQAQQQDLERIHWRQFELLTGEWFRSQGYETTITPPSGDGGIDIRAVRRESDLGPELVVVQVKRLSGKNQVGIDVVKALWTDVNDSSATRGLIATTTVLERGAREFCEARKYRLTAAERGTVEQWLAQLATYPR